MVNSVENEQDKTNVPRHLTAMYGNTTSSCSDNWFPTGSDFFLDALRMFTFRSFAEEIAAAAEADGRT